MIDNKLKAENKIWYAIYTRSRGEKKVAELMKANGFEAYVPLVKTIKQWSDRKKKVEVPLINSYVFVKVSEREYYDVLNTPGVVRYVTFEGKAAPIRDSQMHATKLAVEGSAPIELTNENIEKGQAVKIIAGPMKGAEGEFIRKSKKSKFVINLNQIGFALQLEISAADIVKM